MNYRPAAVTICCFWLASAAHGEEKPMFARQASVATRVISPDRLKSVFLKRLAEEGDEQFPTLVELRIGRKTTASAKIYFGLDTEVLWRSDSSSFTITGSREGLNGAYWTDVFLIRHGQLTSVHVTPMVREAFGQPVKCGWPEYPNVPALTWLQPSGHLLVAAEIVNHSNCDSFGTFKAYEIDVEAQKIVRAFGQLEAKKVFGKYLGEELTDAPDECIRAPKSCYVSANHRER